MILLPVAALFIMVCRFWPLLTVVPVTGGTVLLLTTIGGGVTVELLTTGGFVELLAVMLTGGGITVVLF